MVLLPVRVSEEGCAATWQLLELQGTVEADSDFEGLSIGQFLLDSEVSSVRS